MNNTLTVYREWQSSYSQLTILKDNNNKVKAILSSSINQPKKNQKTIVINGYTFLLDWGQSSKQTFSRKKHLKTEKI